MGSSREMMRIEVEGIEGYRDEREAAKEEDRGTAERRGEEEDEDRREAAE